MEQVLVTQTKMATFKLRISGRIDYEADSEEEAINRATEAYGTNLDDFEVEVEGEERGETKVEK